MTEEELGVASREDARPQPEAGVAATFLVVAAVAKSLTKAQRYHVERGCISGDFYMVTVRALKAKGLFHLVIDSPNGQCGFMRLTPLGEAVRATLKAEGRS